MPLNGIMPVSEIVEFMFLLAVIVTDEGVAQIAPQRTEIIKGPVIALLRPPLSRTCRVAL